MGLTHSTATRYQLVAPAPRSHQIDVVDAAEIDVTNDQAALAAHEAIANTPELRQFCDLVFDGVDTAACRKALATLVLCKRADAQHQGTGSIPGNREGALVLLAERLSPAGKEALQRLLGGTAGNNGFAKYLSEPDGLCLAGHACWRQGKDNVLAGARAKAAEDYETAGDVYKLAGRASWAADAYRQAAEIHMQAARYELAAEIYKMAAGVYTHAKRLPQAAEAYGMASRAHWCAGQPELAAETGLMSGEVCMMGAETLAADDRNEACLMATFAFSMAAQIYAENHLPEKSVEAGTKAIQAILGIDPQEGGADAYTSIAHAYKAVAKAYARAGLNEKAAEVELCAAKNYWNAADAHRQAGQYEKAAKAQRQAAGAYKAAGMSYKQADRHNEAVESFLMAAQAHLRAAETYGRNAQIAKSYLAAAALYAEAGNGERAAATYMLAAAASEQAGWFSTAAKAFSSAAKFYRCLNRHDRAEDAYRMAAKNYMAVAKASTDAGWRLQAADARLQAAKAYAQASLPKEAAAACREAETAYIKAGRPERAAQASAQASRFDIRASGPQLSRAEVIKAINEAIASRQEGLKKGMRSGEITLRMEECRDIFSFVDFDAGADVEWCLVSRGGEKNIYDFVTASTAISMQNVHPILRRELREGDVLQGHDVLAPLLTASPVEPEGLEAAMDEPIAAPEDTANSSTNVPSQK
ncbi:hypothetical protein AB870_12850 [Pandoraea faecigallinarum]|uniref:Uncharacterized protein n=1 Tax=Pandoraea faecigallinarum TaxID=656179 RepID=A0A0H3WRH6_9BURK|nr:hypothetical protein [Pandoraea faecigallinarum]AKM30804.1 hypothetical protein AB870_12850 [Pandoraea faecigallinarum]